MTTANVDTTAAAAPTSVPEVTWPEVAAADWQPIGDDAYTSPAYPGCVLTVAYTNQYAAAAHSLAENAVHTACLDYPDGGWVVFASAPEWECAGVTVYACAPGRNNATE